MQSVCSGTVSTLETPFNSYKPVPNHLKPLVDGVSEQVSVEQKSSLHNLIAEYADVFVGPDGMLGRTDKVKHVIDTGDSKPIKLPPRRLPLSQKEVVKKEIDRMLAEDVIEPSDSPWAAPIVLVTKKDGTPRSCVDYRKLNAITRKDAYPLPRMDDSLDALSGAKWFSTLDLASGYWQVALDENDREKTAFASYKGLFQFKVLPFGLSNSPASFMRLVQVVLHGMTFEQCLAYLDDIIVIGSTFDSALENLKLVFERFREANLKFKPSKCSLFQKHVSYLGHVVSEDGIKCDPKKVESVKNWPTPKNVSEVRSFLGTASYYRRFIKNFSSIAYPLSQLTQKNKPFTWSQTHHEAFDKLKTHLTTSPILTYPSRDGTFILDTDASSYGIGAVLSQLQDNTEKIIAYASKTLNKPQRHYCTSYR